MSNSWCFTLHWTQFFHWYKVGVLRKLFSEKLFVDFSTIAIHVTRELTTTTLEQVLLMTTTTTTMMIKIMIMEVTYKNPRIFTLTRNQSLLFTTRLKFSNRSICYTAPRIWNNLFSHFRKLQVLHHYLPYAPVVIATQAIHSKLKSHPSKTLSALFLERWAYSFQVRHAVSTSAGINFV